MRTLCNALMRSIFMQKPRPKEAATPQRQQSTRDSRGSHEGASAPLVVSGAGKAAETPAKPTTNGAPQKAEKASIRKASTDPAIIVFGYNERRLPQAAWFSGGDADLATRAARLMGLRVLKIEDDTHRELAARLRPGQVYAADQTFAPVALPDVFS